MYYASISPLLLLPVLSPVVFYRIEALGLPSLLWYRPSQAVAHPSVPFPLCGTPQVYQVSGPNLIQNLLQGFNATMIAYGQTGSGKTFTMEGTAQVSCLCIA